MGVRTNFGGVIGGAENELWRSVITRADVRDVGLILHQDLSTAKVAKLQNATTGVQEEVLRLDVTMTDSLGVDVREGPEKLVNVKLHLQDGHSSLHLVEVSRRSVHRLGNVLLHEIEIDLIFLKGNRVSCGSQVQVQSHWSDHSRALRWNSKRPSVRRCWDV